MTPHRQTFAFFVAASLASLATPQPVTAQSLHNPISVTIPFSFENGSQHMEPGRYTVSLTQENILLLRGDANGTNFMVQADQSGRPAEHGKLVFHRYGSRYFLGEVWTAGSSTHLICRRSPAEKQQLQILAQNNAPLASQQVAVLEASR